MKELEAHVSPPSGSGTKLHSIRRQGHQYTIHYSHSRNAHGSGDPPVKSAVVC